MGPGCSGRAKLQKLVFGIVLEGKHFVLKPKKYGNLPIFRKRTAFHGSSSSTSSSDSSSDEERFQRRKSKSMMKARSRWNKTLIIYKMNIVKHTILQQ